MILQECRSELILNLLWRGLVKAMKYRLNKGILNHHLYSHLRNLRITGFLFSSQTQDKIAKHCRFYG